LDAFATVSIHRRWRAAVRATRIPDTYIDEATEDAIIADSSNLYFGFVLQAVFSLNTSARAQRFHPTFVARYHGLSQMGSDLMSSFGFMMPSTSYDRAMATVLREAIDEYKYTHTRYVIYTIGYRDETGNMSQIHHIPIREAIDGVHVVWIDNFSKMYRKQMASIERSVLADALWTGVAARKFTLDGVSTNVMHARGFVVPAMPDDILRDLNEMFQLMTLFTTEEGNMPMLFDQSLMTRWGVNTVPVTPMRDKLPPQVLASMLRTPGRLDSFYPKGLIKVNVGSNIGLCRVMLEVLQSYGHDQETPPLKYLTMTVDCNIFDRIIKAHTHLSFSP
jgi:hypothetical protein